MALRIRLARGGTKKRPHYNIVIADSRNPRDGRFIEKIGFYNPLLPSDHADRLKLDLDSAKAWIGKGAVASDRVHKFLANAGLVKARVHNNPQKAQPKKKAQERAAAAAKAAETAPYSFFHRTETAPADARLDYQLVADGRYITDPQNPRITPSGFGPHSEARMPKFVPSPYLARRDSVPAGRVMPLSLLTGVPPLLARYYVASRPMKAYLPPGYDGLTGLPVVYIVDGFEAAEWASLPTVLDNLIHEGRITPVIALFIPPSARHVEYIGARTEAFAKVLAELIVPAVDRTFRTDPSPSSRAVMGISSGGHFALYAALRRPELFGGAAGQSSTITPRLRELTRRQAAANALPTGLKLYIDVGRFDLIGEYEEGRLDFLALNREYSALLSSLRIPHFYREVNDGHDWANWRERMPDIFIHFFGGNR